LQVHGKCPALVPNAALRVAQRVVHPDPAQFQRRRLGRSRFCRGYSYRGHRSSGLVQSVRSGLFYNQRFIAFGLFYDSGDKPGGTTVPTEARNLLLFVCLLFLTHWALWYYWDFEFGSAKVLGEVISGGAVATVYAASTAHMKRWIKKRYQVVFGSKQLSMFLAIFVGTALVFGCAYSRATIRLPAGYEKIWINGAQNSVEQSAGVSLVSVYGFSFSAIHFEVGAFAKNFRLTPFVPKLVRISENDLFAESSAYRELHSLLLLSFFQYLENSFLSQANTIFDTPDGKHFVELNKVYQILRLCFVDNDLARNSGLQFEGYVEEHKRSPWIPLLRSCIAYSQRQYGAAASYLNSVPDGTPTDMAATYAFFKGVNNLRILAEKMVSGQDDLDLAEAAVGEFNKSEVLLKGESGFFADVARPSAQIFAGITRVYKRDLEGAIQRFTLATTTSHPGLKSRAHNDLGYVDLIRGNLVSSERHFLDALKEDGTYPLARINLGYVYMAQGRYRSARQILGQASRDEFIKSASFRDILLADAALAHLDVIESNQTPDPGVYDTVLSKLKLFNFAGTEPPSLRLAYIHNSLAGQLYTNQNYYGLEIFAAGMYSWAYLEAIEAISAGAGQPAEAIANSSLEQFGKLRNAIDQGWFATRNDSGFFASVYTVFDVTKKH
jgi:tetratricopeptide (TPR) repeat protein